MWKAQSFITHRGQEREGLKRGHPRKPRQCPLAPAACDGSCRLGAAPVSEVWWCPVWVCSPTCRAGATQALWSHLINTHRGLPISCEPGYCPEHPLLSQPVSTAGVPQPLEHLCGPSSFFPSARSLPEPAQPSLIHQPVPLRVREEREPRWHEENSNTHNLARES